MGLKPEGLLCRPEVGEQSQWAAQLSSLCPGSGIEGSSDHRGAKKEKGKDA